MQSAAVGGLDPAVEKKKYPPINRFPSAGFFPNQGGKDQRAGKLESFTEGEEWGSSSPLPEMSIRIESLHLNSLSCQPVFWTEEGCTNSLIFF
jgi:hypothetical protein